MTALAETPNHEAYLDGAELAAEVVRRAEEIRGTLYERGVVRTPLEEFNDFAPEGYEMRVKNEGLQAPGSFKIRGATAVLAQKTQEAEAKGKPITRAVTASDGNHGLCVQAAASVLGLPSCVKMPASISSERKVRLRNAGAKVDECASFELSKQAARREVKTRPGTVYVEAFDSITTMSGQASMALETLEDLFAQHERGEIDITNDEVTIFVAIAGGGMAASYASILQHAREQGLIGENVRLFGVQLENSDAFARDFYGQEPLTDKMLDKSCESTAILEAGKKTMAILLEAECFEGVIHVSRSETGAEMLFMQEKFGMTEPAGALSAAGARKFAAHHDVPNDGRRHVLVTVRCGSDLVTPEQFYHYISEAPEEAKRWHYDVVNRPGTLRWLQEQVADYKEAVGRAAARAALRKSEMEETSRNGVTEAAVAAAQQLAKTRIHKTFVWDAPTHRQGLKRRRTQ